MVCIIRVSYRFPLVYDRNTFLPRAHYDVQGVKQLVLSVVCPLLWTRKSLDGHIWASERLVRTTNLSNLVKYLLHYASKLIDKAHECYKYCVFNGHAYRLQAMCSLLMRTSPKVVCR